MAKKEKPAKKKTPSARVIAARWILRQLGDSYYQETLTTESLTDLLGSKVNDKKRLKVIEFIRKLSDKFRERMEKILIKFKEG